MASVNSFKRCMCLLLFVCFFSSAYSCVVDTSKLDTGELCKDTNFARIWLNLPIDRYGNYQYYFGTAFQGSYYKALEFCNFYGMGLLSIENEEESDFLEKRLKSIGSDKPYSFWTSGTILHGNRQWIWLSTGQLVNYTNWKPHHPDYKKKKGKCIELIYDGGRTQWNNKDCDTNINFICKSPIDNCSYSH